eukprot:TRINITY_DN6417_c0_g4_i2.p1 TRINITY_DN6417_c0_g4~~TRINITY_DN6417_c0_g4_i2.p1  ORF type:complete len:423 (+),score=134.15 TRINITY_DN6417_c0_g4_i2:515-1783(+)
MEYVKAVERMDESVDGYEKSLGKEEFTEERKGKVIGAINEALKNCKETERKYRINLYSAKDARNDYIKTIKTVLNDIQATEENRLDLAIKTTLKVLEEEEQLSSSKNVKLDDAREAVSRVDKDAEIQDIIKSFDVKSKTIEEVVFKRVQARAKELLEKFDAYYTRGGNQAPFNFEAARNAVLTGIEEGKDKRTQEIENEFATLLDHCWNDKDIDASRIAKYKETIKEKVARGIFTDCLNHYRKEGIFWMSIKAFSVLTHLLMELLSVAEASNDIDCALSVMILSQTYYYEQKELGKEPARIYVQQEIADHSLFKRREFWEQVLQQPLNEGSSEIGYEGETVEEKRFRVENEVFVKAGTYAHNMLQFKLDREMAEDIVFKFARERELSEEYLNSIKVLLQRMVAKHRCHREYHEDYCAVQCPA